MNQAIQVLHNQAVKLNDALDTEKMGKIKSEIDRTLGEIRAGHSLFVTGFARLGGLLLEVRKEKYWVDWGFLTFGQYIDTVKKEIQLGRSQIYNSISVSEKLLPYATEQQIENMGITKAIELAKVVKNHNKIPTEGILEAAQNPSVSIEDFKNELSEVYSVQKMDNPGKYHDLTVLAEEDEWQEIQDVFKLAASVDPPISDTVPESIRLKEILWRLCAEFKSGYSYAG